MNLTFEDVEKAVGKTKAPETWRQICIAGGFGALPENFDGGISLAHVDLDAKTRIDQLLKGTATANKSEKEGAK